MLTVGSPRVQVPAAPPLLGLPHSVVEAQQVEALGTPGEVRDPRLVGMQPQPEFGEDVRRSLLGPFGLEAGGAEDDEVVAVPDQRPIPLPG
jgi:hypothetical protein